VCQVQRGTVHQAIAGFVLLIPSPLPQNMHIPRRNDAAVTDSLTRWAIMMRQGKGLHWIRARVSLGRPRDEARYRLAVARRLAATKKRSAESLSAYRVAAVGFEPTTKGL
jgi:hypothetical protein